MQEITAAKPVRDAIFSARGSRGIANPARPELLLRKGALRRT
jgi:hypothetical protein